MTASDLKLKLLTSLSAAGYYLDNEYLDSYIDLMLNYDQITPGYREKHHIQPRAYYKYNNLDLDNSAENLVNLLYKDHIKAHYLLYFCTTGLLQQANASALHYCTSILNKSFQNINLSNEDLLEIQSYMDILYNDESSRYWTDEEIQLLYTLQPKKSNKQQYNLEEMFPGRSYDCILKKANSLGISIKPSKWTEEENNILIKYFPIEGYRVAARLLNRTSAACCRQARLLNLHCSRYWTESEIEILKTFYPKEGKNVYKRLHNRTAATCKMKAQELNLVSEVKWTEEQLKLLKELYPIMGAQCYNKIGKCKQACRQKASQLKIKYIGDAEK